MLPGGGFKADKGLEITELGGSGSNSVGSGWAGRAFNPTSDTLQFAINAEQTSYHDYVSK